MKKVFPLLEDRRVIFNCGRTVEHFLIKEGVQKLLFNFLWDRTVGEGRFKKLMYTRCFFDGDKWWRFGCCDSVGVSEDAVSRAKTDLSKRGIFTFRNKMKGVRHQTLITPNVIGVISFVIEKTEVFYGDESERYGLQVLSDLRDRLSKHMNDGGVKPMKETTGQENTMRALGEKARARGIATRKKIIERRKSSKLKPSWIGSIMREFCELEGCPYNDSWTKKLLGQARNWLKEMELAELEPVELLETVCRRWAEFRTDMTNEDGKKVRLSRSVNFTQFYGYRRQIMDWLVCDMMDGGSEKPDDDERFIVEEGEV